MSTMRARLTVGVAVCGPVLAMAGGLFESSVVMWIGVGVLLLLVLVAVLQVMTGWNLLPDYSEIGIIK